MHVQRVGQRADILDVLRLDNLVFLREEDLEALRLLADADDYAALRPMLQEVLARLAIHATWRPEYNNAAQIRHFDGQQQDRRRSFRLRPRRTPIEYVHGVLHRFAPVLQRQRAREHHDAGDDKNRHASSRPCRSKPSSRLADLPRDACLRTEEVHVGRTRRPRLCVPRKY